MAKSIHKCLECGRYTMKDVCVCGGKTFEAKPAKYSPQDRYGAYRRAAKKEQEQSTSLK